MSLNQKIKATASKVFQRAKHDDLLYLFFQISAASLAVAAPGIAPVAIFLNAVQRGKHKKYSKQQLKNSFYYFQKKGWIDVTYRRGNTAIFLTEEGEKRAKFCGVAKILHEATTDARKTWDGKWRIVFFDLSNEKSKERNAIRLLLRRCGFAFLQKSVWGYPHDCAAEVKFLRSFFLLKENEFRLVVSGEIGEEEHLRKHFQLPLAT
jgi:hypothetical protein